MATPLHELTLPLFKSAFVSLAGGAGVPSTAQPVVRASEDLSEIATTSGSPVSESGLIRSPSCIRCSDDTVIPRFEIGINKNMALFITLYNRMGGCGFSAEDRLKSLFERAMFQSGFTLHYRNSHNATDPDGDVDVYHPIHRYDHPHIHFIFPVFSELTDIINLFKSFLDKYNLSTDYERDVLLLDTFISNVMLYQKGIPTAVSSQASVTQLTTRLYEEVLVRLSTSGSPEPDATITDLRDSEVEALIPPAIYNGA